MLIYFSAIIVIKIAVVFLTTCDAASIFCIFSMASYSHQQPMLALSRALAAKGHNMTVITANPSKVPIENHREIDISFVYDELRQMEQKIGIKIERVTAAKMISVSATVTKHFAQLILSSSVIQNLIREVNGTKYDLLIYEPMFHGHLVAFADIIGNPPIIGLLSFGPPSTISEEVGNPIIPSYIPNKFLPLDNHMTFFEKCYNLFITGYYYFTINYYIRPQYEDLVKRYFGNLKYTVKEMEYNKSLLLLSANAATEYPRPNQPNTIFVGPLHITDNPKPLPKDIQKWMDEAEDGVIYFSLGGNMQGTSVPEAIRTSFIKVFERFPKMRILWKWEADTKLPGQPNNVLAKKWLPQQSILAHPKCRLFISQAGLQSFQEAIHFGVPILAIPIFADQDFNAKKLETSGAGLGVEFFDITDDLLYGKIKELTTNPSYKENMLRLLKISQDQPMSPIDTAIWWVEYVLRHNGAPHLRPAVLDLTWYQSYMLDIIVVFVAVGATILYTISFITRKLLNFTNSKKIKIN